MKELIFAWLAAMIEVALFGSIIKVLFAGIFKLLGVVIKIAFIILAIAVVAFIVWKIVQAIKGKSNVTPNEIKENNDKYAQTNTGTNGASEEKVEDYETCEKSQTLPETGITANIQTGMHMIPCTNCGKLIHESDLFCQFCGIKIIVNDIAQQAVASTPDKPMQQMQRQPQAIPVHTSKKGKSVKLPLIIGAVTFSVIAMLILAALIFGENSGNEQTSSVNLSQTYTNESEGISFQYPSAWELSDPAEYFSTFSDIQASVVLLINKTGQELNSIIEVLKFPVDQGTIDHLFVGNEEFEKTFSSSASIIETSIVEVDGIKARRVAYIEQDELYYLSYMYGVGSILYRINFICHKDQKGSFERFNNAVIESYTIKVSADSNNIDAQSISGESIIYSLDYRGYALVELIGCRREELDDIYGAPTGGTLVDGYLLYGGTEYHEYNDGEMYAIMSEETGTVEDISVMANVIKLNGDTLDMAREEIKKLFGKPSYEDVDYDEYGEEYGYVVEYILAEDGFYLSFWFPDMNTKAYDLTIGRYSEY